MSNYAQAAETVCGVCGYPDWWVDNDCEACGCVPHGEGSAS